MRELLRPTQLCKGDQPAPTFIPEYQPHAAQALHERKPAYCPKLGMIAQHLWQAVIGNAAAQMMNVMHTDIGREPAQDMRQIVMRAAVQRRLVQVPGGGLDPKRILELMLNVEEPNADRGRKQHDGHVHEQEGGDTGDEHRPHDSKRDGHVGCHGAQPRLPAFAGDADRQSVLQNEKIGRA